MPLRASKANFFLLACQGVSQFWKGCPLDLQYSRSGAMSVQSRFGRLQKRHLYLKISGQLSFAHTRGRAYQSRPHRSTTSWQ